VCRLKEDWKLMKIQNSETKEKLTQRLRRVEGQIRGVEAMLEEERLPGNLATVVGDPLCRAERQPHLSPGICHRLSA
jgi:hypothetical protein